MKLVVISDTHFGHKNIIKYCNRPFEDVDAMTKGMIAMWNIVDASDDVYFLGDFAFMGSGPKKAVFSALHGTKHLIRGNHDNGDTCKLPWDSVQDYLEIKPRFETRDENDEPKTYPLHIVMSHFPFLSWHGMAHGSIHLHGHCHGTLMDKGGLRMDAGVDPNEFKMLSLDDVVATMAMRTVVPTDYHKKDHGKEYVA